MPKVFTSEKQKIGEMGENIAVRFLVKHDFVILERNYTKKWGEIDIIAEKEGKIHFIEVKSVSCNLKKPEKDNVSYLSAKASAKADETMNLDKYRAEDNMHPWKMKRLSRTIQTYLLQKDIDSEWQVDLIVVLLDTQNKKAKVRVEKDIIL